MKMVKCEHTIGCPNQARVCDFCFYAQVKANKRLIEINESAMYDCVRLQQELDLAQDEIALLRRKLSENFIRLKVVE
jgi:hypothetical protein